MRDIISNAIWAVLIGGAIVGVCLWFIISSPEPVKADYAIHFDVPKPNEIEAAVSNAVLNLHKQDFVPIIVHVAWVPFKKCYSVKAKGITRDNLTNYKP